LTLSRQLPINSDSLSAGITIEINGVS